MPAGRERRGLSAFLLGHSLSTLGGKMQASALLWHVYTLTESPLALGSLGALELVPLVLLAGAGGVVADRFDRRWVLGIAQAAQGVVALALGLMTLAGQDSVPLLYLAAVAGAAGQAFDTSARKAIVPSLVETSALGRAVAAIDMVKNVGKLAGPALMGLLVAASSLGVVYVLNALSFGAMILALTRVASSRLGSATASATTVSAASQPPVEPRGTTAVESLREGLRFAWSNRMVRSLILLDFFATFTAAAEALLPMVADQVAGVGAAGYGLLASAAAAGALLGGAGLLVTSPARKLGAVALVAVAAYGAATVAFGFSSTFVACFITLAFVGAADTASTVARNTMLQLETPDALRGRITAVSVVFSKSGPRLGQLEAGLVAHLFGLTASIVSGGLLCVGIAAWFAWRHPWVRRPASGGAG